MEEWGKIERIIYVSIYIFIWQYFTTLLFTRIAPFFGVERGKLYLADNGFT